MKCSWVIKLAIGSVILLQILEPTNGIAEETTPTNGNADKDEVLRTWDIFIICILGVLVLNSVVSLLWKWERLERKKNCGGRFLACFSLKRNVLLWLNPTECESFPVVNGMLFLSVAWIMLANTWDLPFMPYYFPEFSNTTSQMDYTDWSLLLITNGKLGMDTLFTITGITVAYNVLKELDFSDGRGGLSYLYVQILLRLTPIYLLVVGLMATVFRFLGDGSLTSFIHHASKNCAANGWRNFLYINNFGNPNMESMCLPDSWYFAVEMQFLVFAPILIWILWKFRKAGFGILTVLILASVAVPALLTYLNKLLPTIIPTREYEQYFTDFYILPWNRASPFLVGLVCGYFLRRSRKAFKLSLPLVCAGWILSTSVALLVIFGLFPYYNSSIKIPEAEAATYAGFHRLAWGVTVCWIVFACSRHRGGWIGTLLSWSFFGPLGKVSMAAFLVALPVQFVHHFQIQPVLYPDTYTKINLFIADLVMTYLVATLLMLILGFPFQHFGDFLKPRGEEEDDLDLDGLEMKRKAERYGIYYNTEVSVCMNAKRDPGRSRNGAIQYPRRERYGIYYDNDVSISMERIK